MGESNLELKSIFVGHRRLENINMPNLSKIKDDIIVYDNDNLKSVNMTNLRTIGTKLEVRENPKLKSINFYPTWFLVLPQLYVDTLQFTICARTMHHQKL